MGQSIKIDLTNIEQIKQYFGSKDHSNDREIVEVIMNDYSWAATEEEEESERSEYMEWLEQIINGDLPYGSLPFESSSLVCVVIELQRRVRNNLIKQGMLDTFTQDVGHYRGDFIDWTSDVAKTGGGVNPEIKRIVELGFLLYNRPLFGKSFRDGIWYGYLIKSEVNELYDLLAKYRGLHKITFVPDVLEMTQTAINASCDLWLYGNA